MKLLLRAAHPARAIARRELAMARARERLERLNAYMERCRVNYRKSGGGVPFDREIESAISETLAMLRV
jgi:hypothetical protein